MTQELLNPDELRQDAEKQQEAERGKLSLEDLLKLGEDLLRKTQEANEISQRLKDKMDEVKNLSENLLPKALLDLKLKNFTLSNGVQMAMTEVVSASITEERRSAAHKWLRENELGDIIKNVVSVTFGKGEDDDAKYLVEEIKTMATNKEIEFGDLEQKEAVHASTLKATVGDRLKKGLPLDMELLGVHVFNRVEIIKEKKKKSA